MSAYIRDDDGKFIPASQRPDGTWRKARRVKDGYTPQEEVPLYESKGKQFTRKPDIPVGMCPLMAKAAQDRRDKQLHKQTKAVAAAAAAALAPPTTVAKSKPDNSKKATAKSSSTKGAATAPTSSVSAKSKPSVVGLQQSLAAISLDNDEEVQKQLKKMRKKIREIEAIEEKLKSGDLKTPEQDQLDKVARKADILRQIAKLEAL